MYFNFFLCIRVVVLPHWRNINNCYAAPARGGRIIHVIVTPSVCLLVRPSVCLSVPCPMLTEISKTTQRSNLYERLFVPRVTGKAIVRSKGQRSRSLGRKCKNYVSRICSRKYIDSDETNTLIPEVSPPLSVAISLNGFLNAGSKRASGGPFLATQTHRFLPFDHVYLETGKFTALRVN